MKFSLTLFLLFSISCCQFGFAQERVAPAKVRRVKRVKRPVFNQTDSPAEGSSSESIFFRDVYSEALVGPRPDATALAESVNSQSNAVATASSKSSNNSWSQLVDAATIEDEVKAQQQKVSQLVTTPVVFQTKYDEVNQSFEVLSVLFSVISQYDSDIRWAEHASAAQMLFQKAAVSSRTGAAAGFRYCKTRKEDLEELVRGGSIVATDPPPETIDWSTAADRSRLMVRLEEANENLKKFTANEGAFKSAVGDINHEANMIALMARVIVLDGMPEAEEDDYVAYGRTMLDAAVELKSSVKVGDFNRASTATNRISQSCVDCHADWR
jgi:hypothetical protein